MTGERNAQCPLLLSTHTDARPTSAGDVGTGGVGTARGGGGERVYLGRGRVDLTYGCIDIVHGALDTRQGADMDRKSASRHRKQLDMPMAPMLDVGGVGWGAAMSSPSSPPSREGEASAAAAGTDTENLQGGGGTIGIDTVVYVPCSIEFDFERRGQPPFWHPKSGFGPAAPPPWIRPRAAGTDRVSCAL